MSIKGLGGLVGRKKSDILAQCRIIPFFYLQEALNLAKEEKEEGCRSPSPCPPPSSPPAAPLMTAGSLALAALQSGQLSLSQVHTVGGEGCHSDKPNNPSAENKI